MKILKSTPLSITLLVAAAFIFIMASLAEAQTSPSNKETWVTVLEDANSLHQLETTSIFRENNDVYHFVHKLTFKKARPTSDGKKITHILTLNAIHCGQQRSVVVADIFYDGETVIAKNLIAKNDYPTDPLEGSPHYAIMKRLCGYPKNYI